MVENKICWRITRYCNLHCRHCLTSYGTNINKELTKEQQIDALYKIIDCMVTRITWTGGEPTLCDSLSKLLGICHSNNITSVVTTHGLTLGSKLYASLDSGFDKLRFSFDGLEKTHNFIRGGYYFNKTINTMIEAKSKGFTIEVNVSVMQNNVTDIPELIVQLEKLGTNKIVLLSLMKRGGASNNNFVRPGEEAYLELNNQLNKLRIIYPWSSPRFNRTLIQPK